MIVTVIKNIKRFRELKNIKQEYMAEMLGISQSAYAKIENNSSELSVNRLEQISKILEVDILLFFSDNGSVFFENNKLENIISQFENLVIENKKLLNELLDTKSKLIRILEKEKKVY